MTTERNPPKTDLAPDLALFITLETRVWQALVAGDPQGDGAMLTPDFLGVYPSGFSDRDDHTGQLANGPIMQSYDLDQARLLTIGDDHALLSYRATYVRAGGDATEVMYISSLWERRDGSWLNSFSQDTPAA